MAGLQNWLLDLNSRKLIFKQQLSVFVFVVKKMSVKCFIEIV